MFDIEVLGDSLKDPVTVGDHAHVVVEISRHDQARGIHRIKSGRLRLFQAINRCKSDLVPFRFESVWSQSGGNYVEKDYGKSRVRYMSRNSGSHSSSAKYRHLANGSARHGRCTDWHADDLSPKRK